MTGDKSIINERHLECLSDSSLQSSWRSTLCDQKVLVLTDFLTEEAFDQLIKEVRSGRAMHKQGQFPTILYQLAQSTEFREMSRILNREKIDCVQNIRWNIAIKDGHSEATPWHYDDVLINWVIPVILDRKCPGNGDLSIFPGLRDSTKKTLHWKAWFFRLPFVRYCLRWKLIRKTAGGEDIHYRANTAYLFYGIELLHGVPWTEKEGKRVVATLNVKDTRYMSEH